jgi:hypothetical protein
MLTGGDEVLRRSNTVAQWRRAGIRGKGERKRSGKAVRKAVIAIQLAEVPKQRGKYY